MIPSMYRADIRNQAVGEKGAPGENAIRQGKQEQQAAATATDLEG